MADLNRARMLRAYGLPSDVAGQIDLDNENREVTVLTLPYWSSVRFRGAISGGNLVVAQTERRAFGYAVGNSAAIAGFDLGPAAAAFGNATLAETNLDQPGTTRDGADVYIWGISAHLEPDGEPALARRIWRETVIFLNLGGNTSIPLGKLAMFPQSGGLTGGAQSAIKRPPLDQAGVVNGGVGAAWNFASNGVPAAANYFKLPSPIKWSGVSRGSDSQFSLSCVPQREITEPMGTARVAAAGEEAFSVPAANGDVGTYQDVTFQLICVSVQKRGRNV